MSALEGTYRKALRWYPKGWRAANEDAVIGTLLDQAEDAHRETPARGELIDLRKNGLARRLGPVGRISPAVRDRAVALAFGLGVGIAIIALVALPLRRATFPAAVLPYFAAYGPFSGVTYAFYGVWILAAIAALLGWKWIARCLALAGIPISIIVHVAFSSALLWPPTTTTIVFTAALALMSLAGNPFATRRGRAWIAASIAGWSAFIALTLWYQAVTKGAVGGREWFIGPFWLWLEWIIPPALILALVLWSVRRSPWCGAIVILLVPLTVLALFGWNPPLYEILDQATLLGLAIVGICGVFFAIEFGRGRIRWTFTRR